MTAFYVGQLAKVNLPESAMHGDEVVIEALNVRAFMHGGISYIGHQVSRTKNTLTSAPPVFEPHELVPMRWLMSELKPCPFCGLDVTDDEGCFPLDREKTLFTVRCGNPSCYAHEPSDGSRKAAIARWNTRYKDIP